MVKVKVPFAVAVVLSTLDLSLTAYALFFRIGFIELHGYQKLHFEPGRAIVGQCGSLITKVLFVKKGINTRFAIVDAGMNDLLRPALYHAEQSILAVTQHPHLKEKNYQVVGPICESSDFLAKNCPLAIQSGDYLAIMDSGAYGFSMSSNYNSRPRAAEIMVDNAQVYLIRSRETLAQLWANERILSASD